MVGFGIPGVGRRGRARARHRTEQAGGTALRLTRHRDRSHRSSLPRTSRCSARQSFPTTREQVACLAYPPLMVAASVYDVTRTNGAVSILHQHGIIPW